METRPRVELAEENAADAPTAPTVRPVLEVGWVLDTRLEEIDRQAAYEAIADVEERLDELFGEFTWRLVRTEREILQAPTEEPVVLLEAGATELSVHHWDFAIVVTASDLRSHYAPAASCAISGALGVAVVSTFRLDPNVRRERSTPSVRQAAIRRRLARLGLYALARLAGLPRASDGAGYMRLPGHELPADRVDELDEEERAVVREELVRVADPRVEEERGAELRGIVSFYGHALWRNRREVVDNLLGSRFWQFPYRMGRLSTAAFSAQAILLLTAESWEVGAQIPAGFLALLAVGAVTATSVYLLQHQRLLVFAHAAGRSEQTVVTRASVALTVVFGMLVTFGVLLAVALALGVLLFHADLVRHWTGQEAVGEALYVRQAVFVAALGILVGALGASFEGQSYVRHVAYVDEEL